MGIQDPPDPSIRKHPNQPRTNQRMRSDHPTHPPDFKKDKTYQTELMLSSDRQSTAAIALQLMIFNKTRNTTNHDPRHLFALFAGVRERTDVARRWMP